MSHIAYCNCNCNCVLPQDLSNGFWYQVLLRLYQMRPFLLDVFNASGIPQMKRGEIWLLLVEQHRLHHRNSARENYIEPFPVQYSDLLKQLTIHQHAILIDLGELL